MHTVCVCERVHATLLIEAASSVAHLVSWHVELELGAQVIGVGHNAVTGTRRLVLPVVVA